MKKLIVGSLASVLASAGLALAQNPAPAVGDMRAVGPHGSEVVVAGDDGSGGPLTPHWPGIVQPECQWYGGLEYLLWWSKRGPLDTPLVTTGSLADAFPGALGQPNTSALLNMGNPFDYETTSGVRMTLGYWFDRQGTFGIEGTGLILEQRSSNHFFSSNGSGAPLLGSPFFNTLLGRQDFNDIAIPLTAVGTIDVSSSTQLYGFELNTISNLYRDDCWSADVVVGFRWLGLDEHLVFQDATTGAPGVTSFFDGVAFPPPAITTNTDNFTTHNHFYGANIGGRFEYKTGNVLLGAGVRVGLGDTNEVIDTHGFSTLRVGPVGPVAVTGGGIYAGPNNSGKFEQDTFAWVPEVDLKIGYQFNCHCSAFVGYTFMYWSDVVRPGDQIDNRVNPTKVPTFAAFGGAGGGPNPLPFFSTTDYWIQGVSFGVEIKF
jgi:hypothetical protein